MRDRVGTPSKGAVDDGVGPGRFLLTGSATRGDSTTHPGVGRIVTLRMRPLSFFDRQLATATVSLATFLEGLCPALVTGPSRGDIRLIAFTTQLEPIRKIPTHLGAPLEPPPVLPARGPPTD